MKRISHTKIALFALSLVPPESFSLQLPIHPQNRHHHHHHHYPLTTTKPSSSSRNLASVTSIAPSPSSTVVETPIAAATVTASSTIHQQQRRTLPRLSEPEIWKLALAGSLATLVSDVAMHPLDCIKTLQQTEEGIGLSMIAAAHFIYHTMGGLTGFSRGFLTWGVCDALGGALKFSTYEGLKRKFNKNWPLENQKRTMIKVSMPPVTTNRH
jgi:Mitochondrial carrier protein